MTFSISRSSIACSCCATDLATFVLGARLFQRGGTQQAADVIGAVGWRGAEHGMTNERSARRRRPPLCAAGGGYFAFSNGKITSPVLYCEGVSTVGASNAPELIELGALDAVILDLQHSAFGPLSALAELDVAHDGLDVVLPM